MDVDQWARQCAARVVPELTQNFEWLLAASTRSGEVKIPVFVERRLDETVFFTASWYGIKEVVKGETGETAIASARPVNESLVLTVPAGATIDEVARVSRLGQLILSHVCQRPGLALERHLNQKEGLQLAARTTGAMLWSWSWPAG